MPEPTRATPRGIQAAAVHGSSSAPHPPDVAQKAAEHLAGWQRARADYENLRRRMERAGANAAEAAKDQLLFRLLPIVDYFAAAVAHVPESRKDDAWTEGVLRTQQALAGFLREAGITPIVATDVPLDPAEHEAVAEVPSAHPPGTIVAVVSTGYRRNGRVLRPAKVTVSKGAQALRHPSQGTVPSLS